ncbi:LANO_0G04830g1_1 [Lachancea nothofagi CBS 11611]|uniref:LANO_0G04830g1_1 n=1 Tax=Lachancea nothofagi CBS 11611 TaxID=1266666 RepID=A0A1G4KGM6_9SACH|nr:LANO_0G04830g1_1 [Lachancea nothofagi CBS 11611]
MLDTIGGVETTGYKKCKDLASFEASGKEIWLIRAPRKLDLSQIKTLPVDFTGEGKATLENKGLTFEVRENLQDDGSGLSVLVPADKHTLVSGTSVNRMFTVSETVDLEQKAQTSKRKASDDELEPEVPEEHKKHKKDKKDKKEKRDKKESKDKKDKKDKKEKKEKKHKHK